MYILYNLKACEKRCDKHVHGLQLFSKNGVIAYVFFLSNYSFKFPPSQTRYRTKISIFNSHQQKLAALQDQNAAHPAPLLLVDPDPVVDGRFLYKSHIFYEFIKAERST